MLIAIDWGTSHRRSYLVAQDGTVVDRQQDNLGILCMSPEAYAPALADLRQGWGDYPVLVSGMAGARGGWTETGYMPTPASLSDLTRGAVSMAGLDCRVLPGVSSEGEGFADVMRGEDIIALGAQAAGLMPDDAQACQPGTHNKWIALEGGRIVSLRTAITGELFAMLGRNGTLAPFLQYPARVNDGFRAGVARSLGARDLLGALFDVRASVLLGRLDPACAASYVSGVLIGADVALAAERGASVIHVLGEGDLAILYAAALAQAGVTAVPIDSDAAFVAGAAAVWSLL